MGYEYEFFYNGIEIKANTLYDVIDQLEENDCSDKEIVEALRESEY